MSWAIDGRPIRSVLVTRLRYLGDIVMSTIVIEVLRRGDPQLRVGFLCEEEYAPVLVGHPEIDRLHRLRTVRSGTDAVARKGLAGPAAESRSYLQTIGDLRREQYDLAVDLFFNPRSAWLLKLAGISRRVGGTRKWRGRLYHHRVLAEEVAQAYPDFRRIAPGGLGEHLSRLAPLTQVSSGLAFADWLPTEFRPCDLKPRLARPDTGPQAKEQLANLGIGLDTAYLILAPSATWPSKEWPPGRWEELIPLLLEIPDIKLAVLVAPGREGQWAHLARLIPPHRGGGLPPLPLSEVLEVTATARVLVTVDGGVMHAGIGLGVPTLALFGPTDPDIWFPYTGTGPFRVLARAPHCHPCDLHECEAFICLPDLEPASVLEAVNALMIQSPPQERWPS